MKRMLRVFGYLKNHSKHGIIVDTQERIIPTNDEVTVNWKEQYPGATEELPPDMPTKILQTQFVHDCRSLKRERRLILLVRDI